MLNILPDAEQFPRETKLLLDRLEGSDEPLGVVGTVEVPSVETGEVLKGAEELVTPDCGRIGKSGLCTEEGEGKRSGAHWLLRRSGGNELPSGGRRGHRRP